MCRNAGGSCDVNLTSDWAGAGSGMTAMFCMSVCMGGSDEAGVSRMVGGCDSMCRSGGNASEMKSQNHTD